MYLNHYQADTYDVIVVGAGHAGSEALLVIPEWAQKRYY